MMEKIAWHYTFSYKVTAIITAGYLRVCPVRPKVGEPQGVWFSTNPLWENTVRKTIITVNEETGKMEPSREPVDRDTLHGLTRFSAIRFAIDCTREGSCGKLYNWRNYQKKLMKAGLAWYAKQLIDTAILWKANSQEWLICYQQVTLFDLMNTVEIWDHEGGQGWLPARLRVDEKTREVEVVPLPIIIKEI